jgi:hypothetical protein
MKIQEAIIFENLCDSLRLPLGVIFKSLSKNALKLRKDLEVAMTMSARVKTRNSCMM